jgi:hypothetical protein
VLDNTICHLLEAGYFPSARLLKGAGFFVWQPKDYIKSGVYLGLKTPAIRAFLKQKLAPGFNANYPVNK